MLEFSSPEIVQEEDRVADNENSNDTTQNKEDQLSALGDDHSTEHTTTAKKQDIADADASDGVAMPFESISLNRINHREHQHQQHQ